MEIITKHLKAAQNNIQEPMIVMMLLDQLPKSSDYFVNDILNHYKVDDLKITTITTSLCNEWTWQHGSGSNSESVNFIKKNNANWFKKWFPQNFEDQNKQFNDKSKPYMLKNQPQADKGKGKQNPRGQNFEWNNTNWQNKKLKQDQGCAAESIKLINRITLDEPGPSKLLLLEWLNIDKEETNLRSLIQWLKKVIPPELWGPK